MNNRLTSNNTANDRWTIKQLKKKSENKMQPNAFVPDMQLQTHGTILNILLFPDLTPCCLPSLL